MPHDKSYDWAQAVVDLAVCAAQDINELVSAAALDPTAGDLSDVDFSELDLTGQNLAGWNLRNANLKNTKLTDTNLNATDLQNATIDANQIIEASEWQNALLSDEVRKAAVKLSTKRPRGTVKWFNPTKGYGFIQPASGGKDIFVHISAVERSGLSTLTEGQTIEFELVENRGKTSAENLKIVG